MARGKKRTIYLPKDELLGLYVDQLWSSYQIAEHFGCSTGPVFKQLKELGVVRKQGNNVRPKPLRKNLPLSEMRDLYVNHMWSAEKLAARYGCSEPTVCVRLRSAGVKVRACNDTKRGAPSPLRAVLAFTDAEIIQAYTSDRYMTIAGLARLIECSGNQITRILVDHGIRRKSLSETIGNTRNGSANPNWRPDLTDEERVTRRDMAAQAKWRMKVWQRDAFACIKCQDATGGNLNAHHIESHNSNRGLRWDVSNGATLCEPCHLEFHKRFGYGNNTAAQLAEYLTPARAGAYPSADNPRMR